MVVLLIPVAEAVCEVASVPSAQKLSVTAVVIEVVAALDKVRVVLEIADTVVPGKIPEPKTTCPTAILALAADSVTVVVPF